QTDGKILVGGSFTILAGQPRSNLGRINADGTLDAEFNPGLGGSAPSVNCLVLQGDGKILVGGRFNTLGGQACTNIARLNANGTLDAGFNPGANGTVNSLAVEADGRILVGGIFTTLGGQTRPRLGRLTARGVLDASFDPGASGQVYALAVQADGEILV